MDGPFTFDDSLVRFGLFAGLLILFALIEAVVPRRSLRVSKSRRWLTNIGMLTITGFIMRFLAAAAVPLTAVAAAYYAEQRGIGLLNAVAWPSWIKFVLALIVLDLAIWAQHYASHKVPLFWRLHQVHHADRDIDVTTAIRFHPIEIVLSMIWKIAVVVPLGASPFAVFVFEAILNGCALFNHANINLPRPLDRIVRLLIVTPDMHRVHHSVYRSEHDTNFGFNLSIWDRLFGTYTAQPRDGHQAMLIGLTPFQTKAPMQLFWSLCLPFFSANASAKNSCTEGPDTDSKSAESSR